MSRFDLGVDEILVIGSQAVHGTIEGPLPDAVSGMRAGFDSALWAQPLDAKLDRIPAVRDPWQRLGIVWLFIGLLLTAGFTAFAFHLSEQGEDVWAALGLGLFLPAAAAFLPLAATMVATASAAADRRTETGETPAWVHPAWNAAWWVEHCLVIGANLAYVAWGWAMVASSCPAEWAGWVAVVSGAGIAAWASLRDSFFQHMVLTREQPPSAPLVGLARRCHRHGARRRSRHRDGLSRPAPR